MARPDEAKGDEGIGAALAKFSEVAAVAAVAAPVERRYSAREVAWVLGVAAALLGLLDIDGLLTWARRMEVGPVRSAWLVALTPVRSGLDAVGVTRPRAALHDAADWVTTRVGTSEDPLVAQGWRAGAERAAGHRATRGSAGTAEAEVEEEPTGSAEEDELPAARGRERRMAGLRQDATGPLDADGRAAAKGEDIEDRPATEASGASRPFDPAMADIAAGRPGAVGTAGAAQGPLAPTASASAEVAAGSTSPSDPAVGHPGARGTEGVAQEPLAPAASAGAEVAASATGPSGTAVGRSGARETEGVAQSPLAPTASATAEVGAGTAGTTAPGGPPTVLLLGDSLIAGSLGGVIARGLSRDGRFRVVHLMQSATGLSRPDLFDWSAVVPPLLEREHPALIICSFGANDGVTLQKGDASLAFGTRGWRAEYRDRVEAMMATLAGTGTNVLWLGLPPMRDPRLVRRSRAINRIFEATTRRVPGVEFFDVRPLVAGPDGAFTTFGTGRDGSLEKLRLDDGVHYAAAGALRVGRWAIDWAWERTGTPRRPANGR